MQIAQKLQLEGPEDQPTSEVVLTMISPRCRESAGAEGAARRHSNHSDCLLRRELTAGQIAWIG